MNELALSPSSPARLDSHSDLLHELSSTERRDPRAKQLRPATAPSHSRPVPIRFPIPFHGGLRWYDMEISSPVPSAPRFCDSRCNSLRSGTRGTACVHADVVDILVVDQDGLEKVPCLFLASGPYAELGHDVEL